MYPAKAYNLTLRAQWVLPANEQNKSVLNLFCNIKHPLLFYMGVLSWDGNILLIMLESLS